MELQDPCTLPEAPHWQHWIENDRHVDLQDSHPCPEGCVAKTDTFQVSSDLIAGASVED